MIKLKNIISKFNTNELKNYLILSVLIIVTIVIISNVHFTEAKYTTDTEVSISPNFAFFIVDVSTQVQHLELDSIIPRVAPYTYTFNVSNFKGNKKANVDLTYSIEVITTTNLPLNIKLFSGTTTNGAENFQETVTQNDDDVYFRHLLFNSVGTMSYSTQTTNTYTLWVEFPASYASTADGYAGVIELVDIRIVAEQVV